MTWSGTIRSPGCARHHPGHPLPALTDAAGATIQGNNITTFLDGSSYNVTVGLNLESDNNIIQGLLIWNFTQYGIRRLVER